MRRKASQRTLFLLCGRGEGVRSLNEPKSQPNKPGGRARKKRKGVGGVGWGGLLKYCFAGHRHRPKGAGREAEIGAPLTKRHQLHLKSI